ncbi:MAG TPA: sigma-70 family RNA polymerase sigma factor, partial [Chloroflexota bacterium]|nr:sigma-70 family RNA polymerase sigma factor [Chloroflexota bacterium]
MDQQTEPFSSRQTDLSGEREGLVRFCHHLLGDPSAAEDCAQETLIRAWQHADQLRDPAARSGWLKAIARNVCRRWLRDHRTAELTMPDHEADGWDGLGRTEPADAFDLEVELDRQELASLLDRAMALLPGETRDLLVERFVRESPLAETAQRLGLSEGAVTMRLRRGKLALRRVLVNAFPEGLETYGVDPGEEGQAWKATRIWCPTCGQRRLEGLFIRDLGVFCLDCPACGPLNTSRCVSLFAQATGHRSALLRLLEWTDQFYKYSFDHATIPCDECGTVLVLRKDVSGAEPRVSYYCHRCQSGTWNGQCSNLLSLPETRQFWKEHPR